MKATFTIVKKESNTSAKHNDRNFDIENAPHIDINRTNENVYINRYKDMTFEEGERQFYEDFYKEALDKQNEIYKSHRQYKRMKTIDDLLKDKNTKVDEMILQIGNKDMSIDKDIFRKILNEFNEKLSKKYYNCHVLNIAIHNDEATTHAHIRCVFDYIDENGLRKISINKSLQQMGVQLPKPNKKEGRYNNRKMTFTEGIRNMWYETIKENGIEIDEQVKNPSQKHKDILTYQNDQEEERQKRLNINLQGYKYKEVIDDVLKGLQVDIDRTAYTQKDMIEIDCAKIISKGIKNACIAKGLEYEEPTKAIEEITK